MNMGCVLPLVTAAHMLALLLNDFEVGLLQDRDSVSFDWGCSCVLTISLLTRHIMTK